MYSCAQRYLFHLPSYSDSKPSRFAVGLLQPWSPLPHGSGRNKPPPRHPHAHGAAFFTQGSEVGLQEQLPEFRREGVWIIDNSSPEGFNASSEFSRPKPVLIIDCKCEKRRPSLPAPDKALRELMTPRVTCGSNSSSGRQLGTLPSSWSEELAATATAAASRTQAWFSRNFAFTRSHVSSFPGARGSARRLRAATVTPPRWRHADDALLNIPASASSRAWPICLVDVRRVYSINHGSKIDIEQIDECSYLIKKKRYVITY